MSLEPLMNMFVVLFVVIDPIGTAAIFAVMSHGMGQAYRRRMALRATVLSALILLAFAVIGDWLLSALGIGLPAFKIAGGLLLFLLAIDMVFARQSGLRSATQAEQDEARLKPDISVFPLAFPLLAGPGALTTILLLVGNARGQPVLFGAVLAVLIAVLALTLLALISAGQLMRLLGETGANVIDRLLGVLLAALAMQFVVEGVRAGLPV